jgi:hypothetical protein
LLLQNVQADASIAIDIGMENLSPEGNLKQIIKTFAKPATLESFVRNVNADSRWKRFWQPKKSYLIYKETLSKWNQLVTTQSSMITVETLVVIRHSLK